MVAVEVDRYVDVYDIAVFERSAEEEMYQRQTALGPKRRTYLSGIP